MEFLVGLAVLMLTLVSVSSVALLCTTYISPFVVGDALLRSSGPWHR